MSYLQPTSTLPIPGRLSLTQFIQTVFVGVSGLPGPLVRPKWQVEPPKQESLTTNWMAIGIDAAIPDANGFLGADSHGIVNSQRHETLEIGLSIYGPDALDTYGLLRDGFQIPENREALRSANMGFVEITAARKVPELVHQRFIDRVVGSVFLRREIQRVYPIVTLISATGTIHSVVGNEQYLINWETP